MVVPDGDPCVLGVREEQVSVGLVGAVAGAVVVEGVNLAVGEGRAVDFGVALVLVDVVAQVQDVVDRLFAGGVAVGVEIALGWGVLVSYWVGIGGLWLTVVGAGVDGKLDAPLDLLRLGWDGLGPSQRALLVRVADVELVVVRGEWL